MNPGTPFVEISLVAASPLLETAVTPAPLAVATILIVTLIGIGSRGFGRQLLRSEADVLAGGGGIGVMISVAELQKISVLSW
jgi:hypothetical protein